MVRFAPFATVKVLSVAALMTKGQDMASALTELATGNSSVNIQGNYQNIWNSFQRNFKDVFVDVGLADNIQITQDFGTRALYGIGEPEDPYLVPNNLSVRVSMSRLSLDGRSISNYVTTPSMWYSRIVQGVMADTFAEIPVVGSAGADYTMYTYLAVSDLEKAGGMTNDLFDAINNFEIIAFMPRTFSKRITSGDAVITTEVEGEGKILRLRKLLDQMFANLPRG